MLYFKWNIEVGKKYEVVLMTRDGLWRYCLGDVIEAIGFDPRDGQLIIHYLEVHPYGHLVDLSHSPCLIMTVMGVSKRCLSTPKDVHLTCIF